MDIYNKIKEIIAEGEKDAQDFYEKNNKAAGTRTRKRMMEIKNLAQDLRKDVLDKSKG
ncbi:histone H1 [Persicobacter psychrovividus]|uniref:Histone H1 n=1 Tax=Persicobacter psychrovividus TaxID=387638 RepID=A0ABN6LHA3_9BACT|nr:histone H1 [Persicobacter psychrovividus]